MNERLSIPALFIAACAIAAIAFWSSPARPADMAEDSIILVAKRQLLGKLFPTHEPSRKVTDPVFLGGPVSPEVIFALVQGRQSPGGRSIRILDDLYLVIDSEVVDSVIEKQPAQARFFAGMVLWRPGELAD